MISEPFIRATEIWLPTDDGSRIYLEGGLYSSLDYFAAISRGMSLAHGEGLPGRAWQARRPIVLDALGSSYFTRKDAALTEGLACAVAIPSFDGDRLTSLVMFFCGDERFGVGALELWSLAECGERLALIEGYFGPARTFEQKSRQVRFAPGEGLPGRVWRSGAPEVLCDVTQGTRFVRKAAALEAGISRAVGVPCEAADGKPWILTFLSARGSPIVGRFEHWRFDAGQGGLRFVDGYCESGADLGRDYADAVLGATGGVYARACRKGIPLIDEDLATDTAHPVALSAVSAGLRSMVAVPRCRNGCYDELFALFF